MKIKNRFLSFLLSLYRKRKDSHLFQTHLKPNDVFLVGHPKSGNTWLAYMLAIMLYRDVDHKINLANLGQFVPYIHGQDSSIERYADLMVPRIFRNEWPRYPSLYPKTIYLIRDPRAVLVSYYHHYCTVMADQQMTWPSFVEAYLADGAIKHFEPALMRWDKQVLQWLERSKHQAVQIIKYENLINDRQRELELLADFIGISADQKEMAFAVARGDFKAMQVNEEKYGAESYPAEIGKRGRFIRRGKATGWKEEMPEHLAAQIEGQFADVLRRVGYL